MKKVLALVLAVMMMATVAMADTIANGSSADTAGKDVKPGKKIKIERAVRDSSPLYEKNDAIFTSNGSGVAAKSTVDYDSPLHLVKDINSENYSVTSLKYNEGKSLIERVYINDDDDQLVIQMKSDFDNTKDRSFDVEFTLKGKGKYTLTASDAATLGTGKKEGDKISTPDADFRIKGTVGFQKAYLWISDTDDDMDAYDDLYETDKAGSDRIAATEGNIENYVIEAVDMGGAYGTMTQDIVDGEVTLEVRVYDGNSFHLGFNTDVNTDVVKNNADAELNFYEWDGNPTFDATAKLFFNDADEDYYVYEIKDGRLVQAGSYSDDDGCWVVKTRTLGAYVVSDTKLATSPAPAGSDNPDTGANDVVGIATALAAVALVSAAAVSLKK